MDYHSAVQSYRLTNLSKQLNTPTLVRVDINLPASDGVIAEDALRMRVNAHILELYADYAGLVVMSHQGRKGDDDFTSLEPHYRLLLKQFPGDIDVDFVPYNAVFTRKTKEKIKNLKRRQVILLDNVRYFDHEKEFDASNSPYIQFFKGLINVCVNESIPTWHREDSSLMCLPYIAKTYIGMRSSYELGILNEVISSKEPKALISGGAKLQKVSYLRKIHESGVEIYTGGLVAQLILRAMGSDLGKTNNRHLKRTFSQEEFEDAKELASLGVHYPIDFVVAKNGENRKLDLKEMPKSKGLIMDIGEGTVEQYAKKLQERPIRIRAGPLGVFEKGYNNGTELTKRIAGEGLIFLGGDTSQEIVQEGLLGHIEDSGGKVCISGGSFLHGMAGNSFPSVDLLLRMLYKS